MKEHKEGTLKSGSGKNVKSRKQALANCVELSAKVRSEDSQKEKEALDGAAATAKRALGRAPAAACADVQKGVGAHAGCGNRHEVDGKTQ
jgi:hypothetical protein